MKRFLIALGLSAVTAGAAGMGIQGCSDSPLPAGPTPVAANPRVSSPQTAYVTKDDLRDVMRKLWTQHVAWERNYLVGAIAGLGDGTQATGRLLTNALDVGDAVKPFHGPAVGDDLARLLRDHVYGASAVVSATQAGDTNSRAVAIDAWYANGEKIARAIAAANPSSSYDDVHAMIVAHLDHTVTQAAARTSGDWAGDARAYDASRTEILSLADVSTESIATDRPGLVSTAGRGSRDETLHLAMRASWGERVAWTRELLIDETAGLPDKSLATARLIQNGVDLGDAFKPFYGSDFGDQLAALLTRYVLDGTAVAAAITLHDVARLRIARAAAFATAEDIGAWLESANPYLISYKLSQAMQAELDQEIAQMSARVAMDWATDIQAYDTGEDFILRLADTISDGVAAQVFSPSSQLR